MGLNCGQPGVGARSGHTIAPAVPNLDGDAFRIRFRQELWASGGKEEVFSEISEKQPPMIRTGFFCPVLRISGRSRNQFAGLLYVTP